MKPDPDRIVIRGVLHLTLEAVARCYDVEIHFLEEAYELGLLGTGETVAGRVVIEATRLDAVARIVHLHHHAGMNVPGIAVLLSDRW